MARCKVTLKRLIVGRNPKRTLVRAVVLGVCCFLFFRYVFRPVWTHGSSMEPTVPNASLHWASEAALWFREPRRGDIVTISRNRWEIFLKRIVGLPGETVAFRNGRLYIDGEPLEEPYVMHNASWNIERRTLKENEYFVVGDNRGVPHAMHKMGVVPEEHITGLFIR